MSTMCIDLREEPATGIGVDRCDQDCKQWEILRDVDPCLPDDQSIVQVPTTCPEKMVSVGTDGTASDLLLRVAQRLAQTDGRLAREVYLEALSLEIFRSLASSSGASAVFKAAQTAPPVLGQPQATDLALEGIINRYTRDYAAALPELRRAIDAFVAWQDMTDRRRWGWLMSCVAMELWDDQRWQNVMAKRTAGGDEAGQPALRGAPVDANLGMVVLTDYRSVSTDWYSKAVICNGLGRYEEARAAAGRVVERDELGLSGWALSELVEACTRTGNSGLAIQALASLRERANAAATDLALGIESRACAVVTEGEAAEDHYRGSIEYLGRTYATIHLARSHLVYGEWLRREGRRVDARLQLRKAQTMFDDMGSRAFSERTRRELLATGETVHKRTFAAYSELTPQEDQIARLASSRLTNSEIGTQLFISPRTVEWHLRKVFTKLGVTSRRELRFS
jgi:DNA-binding CsgD family transcriptional regulator